MRTHVAASLALVAAFAPACVADVVAFATTRADFLLRAVEEIPAGAPVGLAGLEGWKTFGPGYGQPVLTNPHLISFSCLITAGAYNPSDPQFFGPGSHDYVESTGWWDLRPGAAVEEISGYQSSFRVNTTPGNQSQYRLTIDFWACLTAGGELTGSGGSASWSMTATPGYTVGGQTTYFPGIDLNAALPTATVSNQAAPTRFEVVIGRGAAGTGPVLVDVHVDFTYRFHAAAVPGPCAGVLLAGVFSMARRTRRDGGTSA